MTIDQFTKKVVAKTEAQTSKEKQGVESVGMKTEDGKTEFEGREPKTENKENKENSTDQAKGDGMQQKEDSVKKETKVEKIEVKVSFKITTFVY